MNTSSIFSDITLIAVKAALRAGEIISEGLSSNFLITEKTGKQDLVTEIDHLSEKAVLAIIKEHYPHHAILAEESGYINGHPNPTSTWIIDPLDGTNNFSRRLPLFVVSIAVYTPPSIQSAVIYHPITNELFVAEKGKGSYLNGTRLHVTPCSAYNEAMVGIGLPYAHEKELLQSLDLFSFFIRNGVTVRNLGSAALTLAYVAAGKLDAACYIELKSWDIAAGQLLIEEAGGKVTNYKGTAFDILQPSSLIASNGTLYETLFNSIRSVL